MEVMSMSLRLHSCAREGSDSRDKLRRGHVAHRADFCVACVASGLTNTAGRRGCLGGAPLGRSSRVSRRGEASRRARARTSPTPRLYGRTQHSLGRRTMGANG